MSPSVFSSPRSLVSPVLLSATSFLVLLLFGAVAFNAQAATIEVPAGGNLQAAINAAQCGDTIVLQAGSTYFAPADFVAYTLPVKPCSATSYVTITSSIAPPLDGTRVTLANRVNMPKLVARVGSPGFFDVLNKAHHYRFSGLWFTNQKGSDGSGTSYLIGGGQDIGGDINNFAHDIIVDHCFFNPVDWDDNNQQNLYSSVNYAVEIAGFNIVVRDSYIDGFGARYANDQTTVLDSGCALIGTAPGPYTFDNNFCAAWFVGFFIGGSDPGTSNKAMVQQSTTTSATLSQTANLQVGDYISFQMPTTHPDNPFGDAWGAAVIQSINGNNVTFSPTQVTGLNHNKKNGPPPLVGGEARWRGWIPSDINITRNTFFKPPRWFNLNGSDGKGFFEIKLCDRCLIDGNIFDGNTGFTVTVRNQGGAAAWSVIKNLTISNNLVTRFSVGFAGLFNDNQRLSMPSSNIKFINNLMYGDTGPDPVYRLRPKIFVNTALGDAVEFSHNTVIQTGEIMQFGSGTTNAAAEQMTNFIWRDNITNWGTGDQHGYACLNSTTADNSVCTPNYVWTKNVIIGAPTGPLLNARSMASFPAGNWNPATIADVGFTDPANSNYRLLPSSPYYRAASDGKDVGVDMEQLLAHLNGPLPVPTPTPMPSPTPTPTPTATPTPTPTPTPIPTPTPTPTPSLDPILVTAPTGTPLLGVGNGTTINLADLPTRSLSINIVTAVPVGSVKFQHNGQETTENGAPYSLAGDTNGEFNPADLSVGTHTLTVTPYSEANLGGTPGTPVTISFAVVDVPNGTPPTLLTEPNSDRAIALNAATFVPEPFALFTQQNFSSDKRTRVKFFVTNFGSPTVGSDTLVYAENSALGNHSLVIEHIGRVPNFVWLTQITVILPEGLANAGDMWVRVVLRGVSSNQALISIREPASAATIPLIQVTPHVDSWIAPDLRLGRRTATISVARKIEGGSVIPGKRH